MLKVINRHRDDSPGQYIGRGTALGNPFALTDGGRTAAIRQFRNWAIAELAQSREGEFAVALRSLRDRHNAGEEVLLICSCKPAACHGDIIIELIEEGFV